MEISAEFVKALLEHLLNARSRYIDNVLKEQQIKYQKNILEATEASMAVREGRGLVNADILCKSGEPLSLGSIELTKQQQKEFAKTAKQYGLTYSLIKNDYEPNTKLLAFAEKDLEKVNAITNQMAENAKIQEIDNRITQMKEKGITNFTQQDYKDLATLEDLRDGIITESIGRFNQEGNDAVFEKLSNEQKANSKGFEAALNKNTARNYSTNEPCYVADRTDPTKYIEMNSERVNFNGVDHTKTDYTVFKDNTEVHKCSDGPFKGKTPTHWSNIKNEMREAGGFSDDVVIFKNKDDFEEYRQAFELQAFEEQSKELQQALTDKGALFDEKAGTVYVANQFDDKGSMETAQSYLLKQPGLPVAEKQKLCEAIVIGDMIKLSKNIEFLENEKARIEYLQRGMKFGTHEFNSLTSHKMSTDTKITQCKELMANRALTRSSLASVRAVNAIGFVAGLSQVQQVVANQNQQRNRSDGKIRKSLDELQKTGWRQPIKNIQKAKKQYER